MARDVKSNNVRMMIRLLFKVLLGLAAMSGAVLQAQRIPTVVVSDPPSDETYPPTLVVVTILSHGVDMDGTLYLAAGAGSHGTVLLLHGLPGYASNGHPAQSILRAGWDVLLFNYRGTWGTSGVLAVIRYRRFGRGGAFRDYHSRFMMFLSWSSSVPRWPSGVGGRWLAEKPPRQFER
jgi:pimeloyl-ACP methyl ester carboxylesterase